MTELESLYLEQTKRLAAVTAALGIMPDQTPEALSEQARKLVADRQRLYTAGNAVVHSATPSLGQWFISPVALDRLEAAIETAQQNGGVS